MSIYRFDKCKIDKQQVIDAAKRFHVTIEGSDDYFTLSGDDNDVNDFLTFCSDFDDNAKITLIESGVVNPSQMTPEKALRMIDDFICSKGKFEGYDLALRTLMNAIDV